MKIKTSELEGAALDYAVAAATGVHDDGEHAVMEIGLGRYSPSIDWSQGGPLIDKHISEMTSAEICWEHFYLGTSEQPWHAQAERAFGIGPTMLIAAMRAIVASELGDEVDVPDELAGEAA